ncbi:MAG TPA: diacylglycerol kinase family protein [bacterium]
MKLLLIVNPVAGKNKGDKAIREATPLLAEKGIQYDVKISEYSGHATQIAREFDPSKFDGIVAVGGDGTLFEILNGLLKTHRDFVLPIGQIPVGTGNSFIKDLNIQTIADAVGKIAGGKTRKVDVGFFKYPEGEHYFINLLGTGFVANVAHRAGKYKALGPLSYVIGVFEEVARLHPIPMEMTIDGQVFQRDYIFAEICNSTKTGGNMIMAPDAKIDDGLLDVILLNDISKLNLLKVFPQIFKGTHVNDSHVETFKGRHIKIVTETPQRLTPDGEVFGTTPIEVSILPNKIAMFC